jgi:hypothetical protein
MVTDPQVRLLRLRSARTKRFKRSMPRVAGMSVRTARVWERGPSFHHATELGVTIAGVLFPHLLFDFALSFSGWR